MNKLEQLIREAYSNDDLSKLLKIINMKYKNRRVVATTNDSLNLNKKIDQKQLKNFFKPNGLWYALGGGWLDFLESNWESHNFQYENMFYIDIDYSQILRINTKDKFEKFENKFAASLNGGRYKMINWVSVSEEYKGVEIIPHMTEMRFDSFWYSTWDIASGCIWDTTAIKDYKQIQI